MEPSGLSETEEGLSGNPEPRDADLGGNPVPNREKETGMSEHPIPRSRQARQHSLGDDAGGGGGGTPSQPSPCPPAETETSISESDEDRPQQTSTVRYARWADEQHRESESRATNWEGDAAKKAAKKGLHMFRTISCNHQKGLSLRSTTITKTEKERRWRAEWDFWWRNKVDVACSQETGLAGDDGDLR